MVHYETEFKIGDKVEIIIGVDCVQTSSNNGSFNYLFRKKSKSECVEYYIHDIEITYSVNEGFKGCRYLLSSDAECISQSNSGWVNGKSIVKVEQKLAV